MGILYRIMNDHKKIRKMLAELKKWADKDVIVSIEEISPKIRRLGEFWDEHERREEELFNALMKQNIKIPFQKLDIAHKEIKGHWKVICSALGSKEIEKIRVAIDTDGRMFIKKIKEHMGYEEPVFRDLNFNLPFSPE